jgi:hypothetical protein
MKYIDAYLRTSLVNLCVFTCNCVENEVTGEHLKKAANIATVEFAALTTMLQDYEPSGRPQYAIENLSRSNQEDYKRVARNVKVLNALARDEA